MSFLWGFQAFALQHNKNNKKCLKSIISGGPGAPGRPGAPGIITFFFEKSVFYDCLDVGQYFAYKRDLNTIVWPRDLSRIVEHGLLYILIEYNVFWTGPA